MTFDVHERAFMNVVRSGQGKDANGVRTNGGGRGGGRCSKEMLVFNARRGAWVPPRTSAQRGNTSDKLSECVSNGALAKLVCVVALKANPRKRKNTPFGKTRRPGGRSVTFGVAFGAAFDERGHEVVACVRSGVR